MTEAEAVSYIETYTWSTTRLGLERTRELLFRLGDPQKRLKFIHVAGSNGKGSTCAMLESVLRSAGYRTGLYISPHLQSFRERFQINGVPVPGERFAAVTERVRTAAEGMADHPSQFELSTAIAMLCFLEEACEIVVLEVGLGGALDSTNAIGAPEAAVITNLGLEHTEYLGSTIEEIAAAKGGIIKAGCVCVCYDSEPAALAVIKEICTRQGVPLYKSDPGSLRLLGQSLEGQRAAWKGLRFTVPLLGMHQLHNAAVALRTVEVLRQRGWRIPDNAVCTGLASVRWPARFEVLSLDPLFILDGGHNPQCVRALVRCLEEYLPGQRFTFLMGVLADKDYSAMLDKVFPKAAGFVCIAPDSPRALPAETLAGLIRKRGAEAVVCASPEDALSAALAQKRPVIAFGSLYMAGALRTCFPACCKKILREKCLTARRALAPVVRARACLAICRRLEQLPELQNAHTILSYRALWDEADLSAFHVWARAAGKRLAFPLLLGQGCMEAAIPLDDDGWGTDRYGIAAPLPGRSTVVPPEELDAVLLPCVGADRSGGRLGRGGGYYDRYLPRCPQAAHISAAFSVQLLADIPLEATDCPVDAIVTESTVFRPEGKNK